MTVALDVAGEGSVVPETVGSGVSISAATVMGDRSRESMIVKKKNFRIARIHE